MSEIERKKRVLINSEIFNQIKRLYKIKTKKELMEITSLSKNAINVAIRKIETAENDDVTFDSLYKTAGRRKKNKESLHSEIRSIMGNDNSLTIGGCKDKLSRNLSCSQICREMKAAGLSRKRLKKRSKVTLTPANIEQRQVFCAQILGMRTRPILFLDESGFNLHTSINYGYSLVNQDAVLYQPSSKGRNLSLCAIISSSGIEHFKIISGAFERNIFMTFLEECYDKQLFESNPILVMDNVRFHHCIELKEYLISKNVKNFYLPPYSPDLNPIENVFSSIKARLNLIRPRAETRDVLQLNIENTIAGLADFSEYYRHFWEIVNGINNRQIL